MRVTKVRKLLPDSWGFYCPVHTPDGAPCGLINHMAYSCRIALWNQIADPKEVTAELALVGLTPGIKRTSPNTIPVLLDGRVLGEIPLALIGIVDQRIRKLKLAKQVIIPPSLEVAVCTVNQLPALYLFSGPGRFTRPVINLSFGGKEIIGPLEQLYLNIAVRNEDIGDDTSHREITPMNMFSIVAGLTPFCNNNQSPRNMYQCQMAKQTMGTPYQSFPYRYDNKSFRLQNPQTPIVRNEWWNELYLDEYLTGTNAVVAVLAYTGYDMEDAMIINKSALERGLKHGCVYKSDLIDLTEDNPSPDQTWFNNVTNELKHCKTLDQTDYLK
jgi:DNA-directed RNA polymerase I subunit RPA2